MRAFSRIAAWLFLFLTIAGLAGGSYLDAFVNPQAPGESSTATDLLWALSFVGFPVVGSIILFRLPHNAIGWILSGLGAMLGLGFFCAEYAQYAYVTRDGDVFGGPLAAWLTSWGVQVTSSLIILLLVLFPHGRPRNVFWRWVTRYVVVATVALAAIYSVRAGPLDNSRDVENPFGIESLNQYTEPIIPILGLSLVVVMLTTIVDKIIVYRRSSGDERQQLRWFAFSGLLFPLLFAATMALGAIVGSESMFFDPILIAFVLGFNALAISIGVAVFKYRLYDIGLFLNRTLVYGGLTLILAAAYVGLVFAFQAVLAPFTTTSDLAVAGSTLAVAALFRPVRAHLQAFIDRRFYRRKVDAQRTLEAFSSDLRDEVELKAVSDRLVEVVYDVVQPAHVSLWVKT